MKNGDKLAFFGQTLHFRSKFRTLQMALWIFFLCTHILKTNGEKTNKLG